VSDELMDSPATLADRLRRFGQEHLLNRWDELDSSARSRLAAQIESVDFELLGQLFDEPDHEAGSASLESPAAQADRAVPPGEVVRLPHTPADEDQRSEAVRCGERMLAEGKVGAILVAGGQGSRLGFPHPKGMYPIGPVSGCSLFQILIEQLLARSRRAGVAIPLYVMTSDATHHETIAFFKKQTFFGLDPADVFFFRQGNMPAVDPADGRILMADAGTLCLSPDGHGGMLYALTRADLFDEMQQRGIELLYYHQVDNPTAVVCDPAFLGFHELRGSEMSIKVVAKRSADEPMGLVCAVDGRTQIIEYSDLPGDIARRTDSAGNLLHWAGSTAIHVFDRAFLQRVAGAADGLPFHRAHKKVACVNDRGEAITPTQPNAWKFERFIFDALPLAKTALVMEADRRWEFNPVKNAEGHDTPATARAAMLALHHGWLKSAGAQIAEGVSVELSPLFALDEQDVKEQVPPGRLFSQSVWLTKG